MCEGGATGVPNRPAEKLPRDKKRTRTNKAMRGDRCEILPNTSGKSLHRSGDESSFVEENVSLLQVRGLPRWPSLQSLRDDQEGMARKMAE
jgi:hypothetical protein